MGSFMQKKSSFAERCNLLSQYLKEKGSFGDICFDMNGDNHASRQHPASATTMNLLPNLGNSSSDVNIPAFNSSTSIEDPSNMPEDFSGYRMKKPAAAAMEAEDHHGSTSKKMTIFYGGKVLVFDELSPEKVKEILALVAPTTPAAAAVNTNNNSTRDSGDHNMDNYSGRPAVTPDLNVVASTSGEDEDNISINAIHGQENRRQRQHSQMRKASLHRFLGKRKDRVTGKAPYPINNVPKPEKPSQWIQHEGQGQSSNQLELKL